MYKNEKYKRLLSKLFFFVVPVPQQSIGARAGSNCRCVYFNEFRKRYNPQH